MTKKAKAVYLLEVPFCQTPLHVAYKDFGKDLTCHVRHDGARLVRIELPSNATSETITETVESLSEHPNVYRVATLPDNFPKDPHFPTILPA